MSLSSVYHKVKRVQYLIGKWLSDTDKRIVVYNKKHPIYTSIFEDTTFARYKFVYINFNQPLNFIERKLFAKASIVHSDAAMLKLDLFKDKNLIVECEGLPSKEILTNKAIKKVYFESNSAVASMPDTKGLELLYPSISVSTVSANRNKLEGAPIVLLTVGYGSMIKGFDVVYKIYETLKDKYNIKLIMAGAFGHNFNIYPEVEKAAYDKADFPAIKDKLVADPNVQLGPIRREELVGNTYNNADIFLHFCRMETFGYSLLEAMNAGLPVIASNFRAIPEMVVNDETGILVNDFADDINSKEWFDKSYNEGLAAVIRLIEDRELRQRLGANAQKRIAQYFNVAHKKIVLEEEYDRILGA